MLRKYSIIIGAGQAAAQAVQSLRGEGFDGAITLIGDEAYAPYQRPPLSKAYLLGSFARERLFLKPDAFYAEAGLRTDSEHHGARPSTAPRDRGVAGRAQAAL